jgi:hypothetical protein
MSKKNTNVSAGTKPFGAMDEDSFQQLIALIEGQYIFVCGTEMTIKGTIKELKKMHGVDAPILKRFKFLASPLMVDNDFTIIKKENKSFEQMMRLYKSGAGRWIEIT